MKTERSDGAFFFFRYPLLKRRGAGGTRPSSLPQPFRLPTSLRLFMSLADLERSLLARLEASGELSKLRASAREAALRELDDLSSSSSPSASASKSKTAAKQKPRPPAETVVALELVGEFLDFHGFGRAKSLLEAEANLPPSSSASSSFGRRRGGGGGGGGGASFFGRRALASLVGVQEGGGEDYDGDGRDELRPPPLLYSVMAAAAAASNAAAASRKKVSEEAR